MSHHHLALRVGRDWSGVGLFVMLVYGLGADADGVVCGFVVCG